MKKLGLLIVVLALLGLAFHAFAADVKLASKKGKANLRVEDITKSNKVSSCSAIKSDKGESRTVAEIEGTSGKVAPSVAPAGSTTHEGK